MNFAINLNRAIARWRDRRAISLAKNWNNHVDDVEMVAHTAAFEALRREILTLAQLRPGDRMLDVGAGTGLLALSGAPDVADVTAVDISRSMCARLQENQARLGLTNVTVHNASAVDLPLPCESIDVAVSSYCFHHMRDRDKLRALGELARVMRPGGRIVIADMMFRVGLGAPRDRAIVFGFATRMLRKGPSGVSRLARNTLRLLAGRGEHPADASWWNSALRDAGFIDVKVRELEHEGGIATAVRDGQGLPLKTLIVRLGRTEGRRRAFRMPSGATLPGKH